MRMQRTEGQLSGDSGSEGFELGIDTPSTAEIASGWEQVFGCVSYRCL